MTLCAGPVVVKPCLLDSDRGTALALILKPPGAVACMSSPMALTKRSMGMLPMPLPISVIAEERNAALGSVMSGALTVPT